MVTADEYHLMARVEDDLWWYVGMRAIVREVLARYLPDRQDLDILDTGCGTGANLRLLADYGAVVGVDLAEPAARLAHARGQLRVARADVSRLPFAAARFDLTTSFDVLPMLPVGLDRLALSELARVTRPGGVAIVRVAAHDWLRGAHDRFWAIAHRYGRRELRAKLEGAGFRVAHIGYLNSWLFPLAAAKRLTEPLLPAQRRSDLALSAGGLNAPLARLLASEAGPFLRGWLPTGLSLMAVAHKPEAGQRPLKV